MNKVSWTTWYHLSLSMAIIGLFPVANIWYHFMPIWIVIPNTFISIFGILRSIRYLAMIYSDVDKPLLEKVE